MSISFAAALAGTVLAAVGTGLAIRLCLRKPRADMVAWVIALAGLTVGLAAQAAGYRRGFVPTTFRVAQLGAALVAPLALAWGMAELAAKGLVARFAGRLCLAGLFVVAAVILATDVLSAQPFTQEWPAARDHFEFLPLGLLALVAVVVVLTVVVALITTGLRSRHDPAWRGPLAAVALASLAALATQGLQAKLPANVAFPVLTLIAAVAAWLAASRAAGMSLGQIRGGASRPAGPGTAGDPGYGGDDSLDLYRDGYRHFDDSAAFAAYVNSGYDTGGYRSPAGPTAPGTAAREDSLVRKHVPVRTQGPPDAGARRPATRIRADSGWPLPVRGASAAEGHGRLSTPTRSSRSPGPSTRCSGRAHPRPRARPPDAPAATRTLNRASAALTPGEDIEFATGMQLPAIDDVIEAAVASAGAVDTDRLYGRIAIYTLLDAGAEEFDRLAEQVVEQVRTGEPGTLAYVVHGVPSAPLQRILYQLYADRAAYDWHQERPYVADFEARRRPLVLATNVIELGVRQAKVAAVTPRRVP